MGDAADDIDRLIDRERESDAMEEAEEMEDWGSDAVDISDSFLNPYTIGQMRGGDS